jgi:hypothetical protein
MAVKRCIPTRPSNPLISALPQIYTSKIMFCTSMIKRAPNDLESAPLLSVCFFKKVNTGPAMSRREKIAEQRNPTPPKKS